MLLDFITLDKSGEAMYLQLYKKIYSAVKSGIIKNGERLPSIREAAAQLKTSRTTVENAYLRLCIEGIAESSPQRGYYICGRIKPETAASPAKSEENKIIYDFSGRKIDSAAADTDFWKKTVREVLRDTDTLISYGDPQGEYALREALAAYSYKARGVRTSPENIVIGAGIGPLLNILCGLIGRENKVGAEGSGFLQAKQIFADYGIDTESLPTDKNGAKTEALIGSDINILLLMPSVLSKISITGISSRRIEFAKWANENEKRLIIEDDYNGELRYTARSLNAFQGQSPENTVYIGSFSKLLLPSVRIAYMALPDRLLEKFNLRRGVYNQTCGKTEQIALEKYIKTGELEKHLRRLRKLYYSKSQYFYSALEGIFPNAEITVFETSISAEVDFKTDRESIDICLAAGKSGILILPTEKKGRVRMCFAGIPDGDILPALSLLKNLI